jgi:hypothetical protein
MPGQTKDQAKQELMLDTKKRRAKYSKKSTFVGPLQVNFRCAVVVMQVPSEESDVVSSGESIDSMSWLIARGKQLMYGTRRPRPGNQIRPLGVESRF